MHRIGLGSLSRRHVKEARVEEPRFVDKASIGRMARITDLAVGVVMLSYIKAIRWYLVTLTYDRATNV